MHAVTCERRHNAYLILHLRHDLNYVRYPANTKVTRCTMLATN